MSEPVLQGKNLERAFQLFGRHQEPGLSGNWASSVAFDGADNAVLYLGLSDGQYGSGVYRSASGGLWERATVGLEAGGVTAIASDTAATAIYAGTADRVYKIIGQKLSGGWIEDLRTQRERRRIVSVSSGDQGS